MRVRLLRSLATATRVYSAGDAVNVPDELALRWCQEGVAEPEDPGELHELLERQQQAEEPTEGDGEGEAEAKAQENPPEDKARQAPPEDKAAGVTEDGGAGDAGGSEGDAAKPRRGRRAGN
ncbi:MAG: hypothetical protein DIU55_006075 [Bacillota bacterium]